MAARSAPVTRRTPTWLASPSTTKWVWARTVVVSTGASSTSMNACCSSIHSAPARGRDDSRTAGPPVENANSGRPPIGVPSSAVSPGRTRNAQRTPAGRSRAKSYAHSRLSIQRALPASGQAISNTSVAGRGSPSGTIGAENRAVTWRTPLTTPCGLKLVIWAGAGAWAVARAGTLSAAARRSSATARRSSAPARSGRSLAIRVWTFLRHRDILFMLVEQRFTHSARSSQDSAPSVPAMLTRHRRWLERVQPGHASPLDIANVPRHKGQPMNTRSGGEEQIDDRTGADRTQTPPFLGHAAIDGQDAVGVVPEQLGQPSLQRPGSPRVLPPKRLDAPADLA